MSLFKSLSRALQVPLKAVTKSAQAIDETIDIANKYVHWNHVRLTESIKEDARISLSAHHADIAEQLDADANLKAQYDKLEDLFA